MALTRQLRSAAAAAVIVFALGACGSDSSTGSSSTTVAPKDAPAAGSTSDQIEVKGFAFNPEATTVKVGTKVIWTFKDSAAHSVEPVGSSELKKSPDLKDGTYSFTFTKAGTVSYRCGIHNFMTGKVVVTA